MIVKVCGLGDANQILEMDQQEKIEYLGFIFYSKSKRYIDKKVISTKNKKRVGVFVNQSIEEIINKIIEFELDIIQLHGDESVEYVIEIKQKMKELINRKMKVFKAFGIDRFTDFKKINNYNAFVDCFLFDTKSVDYGGTGKTFDWTILNNYTGVTPFLLSGGISIEMVEKIKMVEHSKCIGIDINSGFEISPKNKDVKKIIEFIEKLK